MSASKVVRTLKVAHACKCQVAEHSKQDIPEDLKDLLKRVDNSLQQIDTVCDRYLDGENEDQLEMIIEACQRSFHQLIYMLQDHSITSYHSTTFALMASCKLPP